MDTPLSDQARILLAIVREATAQNISIPIALNLIIRKHMFISDEEARQIGEILKADARERFTFSPNYGEINAMLKLISGEGE